MDRLTRREIQHIMQKVDDLQRRVRNIPLRVGGGASRGGSGDSVELSDADPQAVGNSTSAGTGTKAARDDHVHANEGESIPEVVQTLPAIPTTGMKEVYWTSTGAGTGDDQVWRAFAGQSQWFPTQRLTDLSGNPGV